MAEAGPSQNQRSNNTLDPACSHASRSHTETVVEDPCQAAERSPILTLRLQQPDKQEHRVKWTSDTVDNEFMGKKKSKCCCIYEKPKVFGESESSSEEEEEEGCTPHCRGHKKKCFRHHKSHDQDEAHGHDDDDYCDGHSHDHHNHGGRDYDRPGAT